MSEKQSNVRLKMSDSNYSSSEDEVINSSGDENEVDDKQSNLPSTDVTVESSDEQSSKESHNTGASSGESSKLVSSDEEAVEDEDDNSEQRAFSPRTRMSITGVRPADLTDDSSEFESADETVAQESSDDDSIVVPKNRNVRKVLVSEDDSKESEEDDSCERRAFSPRTRMSIAGVRPADISHELSTLESVNESTQHESGADSKIAAQKSDVAETLEETDVSRRYTMLFERDIREKLSSTIRQDPQEYRNEQSVVVSDDSDVEIINVKPVAIEISSGDSDVGVVNTPVVKRELVQPKISATMFKKPLADAANPQVNIEYVSQEYYDKQNRKIEEMKLEILNAEKLLDTIASNLPDGGLQLKLRIDRLYQEMKKQAKYLVSLVVEENTRQIPENKLKPPISTKEPDWNELSAAVNQMQPLHSGKRGITTFENQKVLTVERLKDLHGSLETCPTENVLADDPPGLRVTLMDHQKHALAWMKWRERQKPHGGILADDMGLGKTLTMISLVLSSKSSDDIENEPVSSDGSSDSEATTSKGGWSSKGRKEYYQGGTLVICPASLLRQWDCEVESKVSRNKLTVCVHHGNNRDTKPRHLRTYDIVVSTYNIIGREHKSHGATFGIKWRRIILDEAHVVRNHKSQSCIAVCSLKGKYRWALTGTPIHNKEMDVYALLKFLRCSPFDDLTHWKRWIDNKSAGGQQRLNTIMKTILLRRTKLQLQERGELQCLPDKRTELIEVLLDKEEMNVYQKVLVYSRSLFAQFLFQRAERNSDLMYKEQGNRPTFMQSKDPNGAYYKLHQKFTRYHNDAEVKSHEILVLLLRLRQICCHPGLIDSMLENEDPQGLGLEEDNQQQEIDLLDQLQKLAIDGESEAAVDLNSEAKLDSSENERIARASAKVLQRNNPVFNLKRPSSKMVKVLDVLTKISRDDKAIVVSQWTSVLNILQDHLRTQGIETLALNGTVAVNNRQSIVTEFNNATSRKRVLLLSLTAGGVGLNLVGANHLLLIDLHWNPQLEAQAQDRIYRVGQKKSVAIYKFMVKDTVEERIKALQEHKLALANNVLTGAKATGGSKLTIEDLKGLFGM